MPSLKDLIVSWMLATGSSSPLMQWMTQPKAVGGGETKYSPIGRSKTQFGAPAASTAIPGTRRRSWMTSPRVPMISMRMTPFCLGEEPVF